MGWSTAWPHVMLDDVVTLSFKFNGHRSSEEATQALKKINNRKTAIKVKAWLIIKS